MAFRLVLVDRYTYTTTDATDGSVDYHVARKDEVIDVTAAEAARGDALGALSAHAGPATGPSTTLTGAADEDVITVVEDATTARTLALTDRNKLLRFTSATAVTVTVPADDTVAFPLGSRVHAMQAGAGQVTFAAAAGVTVNATPGLRIGSRYGGVTLFKTAANVWLALGSLAA